MAEAHWSYGHNVSGYVPESDVIHVDGWENARIGLRDELEYERDSLGYAEDDDQRAQALWESVTEAIDAVNAATAGQEFLAYTDDGGQHTIPTAWWINVCAEDHETDADGEYREQG